MKILSNKIMPTIALIFALISMSGLNCLALVSVTANSEMVYTGQNIALTVTIDADEEMYAAEFYISYDKNLLSFSSGDSAYGQNGKIHVVASLDKKTQAVFVLNFTAISTGISKLSVYDCVYVGAGDDEVLVNSSNAMVKLTVIKESDTFIEYDVNSDGDVNIKDMIRLKRYLSGGIKEVNFAVIDADKNGLIDSADLVMLSKYLLTKGIL